MKDFFPILMRSPLFANIAETDLAAMLACLDARVQPFARGAVIMAEGSPARYLGVVLQGRAQVSRIDYDGNRSILAALAPADLFAESFACAAVPALPISVVATEDCVVLLVDCRRLTTTCTSACAFHARLIENLMQALARHNLHLTQKLEILSQRSTRQKLLSYLQAQSRTAGSRCFEIPYNRQELADFLEVDRSGLSAEIGKLRREGVLTSYRNRFELL